MNPRALPVAVLTALIETVGFLAWRQGIAAGMALLGLVGFDLVLIGEHVVQAQLLTGRVRLPEILIFSQIETFAVWGAGLAIANALDVPIIAPLWWTLGLTVEHTLTENVLLGKALFARLFDPRDLLASAIEAGGGYLGLLPGPVLAAALYWFVPNTVEHAVLDARIPEPA
jgi:hypothetical protein